MSTNDVPGNDPDNADELHSGCWAEHDDGSLIFVTDTENGRVIYSMFDMSKEPIQEYRDSMAEERFKKFFSWNDADPYNKVGKKGKKTVPKEKWVWHDKTPFPWDKIIKHGATDGPRYASATDLLTAAERVAQSLKLRASEVSGDLSHLTERTIRRAGGILDKLKRAASELRK